MNHGKLKLSVEVQQRNDDPIKISMLNNAIYYFIEMVFIMVVEEGYRLVAIHQGRLLADEVYQSAKGAKIAFLKFFSYKGWKEGVKPEWSHFYPPNSAWLGRKLNAANAPLVPREAIPTPKAG